MRSIGLGVIIGAVIGGVFLKIHFLQDVPMMVVIKDYWILAALDLGLLLIGLVLVYFPKLRKAKLRKR